VYFDFLYNFFFPEKFLILRKPGRFVIVNVRMCSCESTNYSCPILMRLEFSGQIFRKKKVFGCQKFHLKKYASAGSGVVPYGRTGKQT